MLSPDTIDLLFQALDNVQISVTGASIADTAALIAKARSELEAERIDIEAERAAALAAAAHDHSGRVVDTNPPVYPDCPGCFATAAVAQDAVTDRLDSPAWEQ